jgi:Zn-dependent M32 family carboxypeptidase
MLYNIALQGCLRVEKEETDIFGNKKRPGDILIDNMEDGRKVRKVLYAVGITCPMKIGTLRQSAVESGYAANLSGKQKKEKDKEGM